MGFKTIKETVLILLLLFITSFSASAATVDNTKTVAVFIEQLTPGQMQHDPHTNAIFLDQSLKYVNGSSIADVHKSNTNTLIVPLPYASDASINEIRRYMSEGGDVWFFCSPAYDENKKFDPNRIPELGAWSQYNTLGRTLRISRDNNLVPGLPARIKTINTADRYIDMVALPSPAGKNCGYNYSVAIDMGYWDGAMLVRYWNTTTGSRLVYSCPDLYVTGGTTNVFNRSVADFVLMKSKSFVTKNEESKYNVKVTYPGGDRQFTMTIDDEQASDSDIIMNSEYWKMKDSLGFDTPDTYYISTSDATTRTGILAYAKYGSVNTQHPHAAKCIWSNKTLSVADAKQNITDLQNKSALAYGEPIPQTNYRFPGTNGVVNAYQAFSELGYTCSSNSGPYTGMGPIGDVAYNNIFFPHEKIISGVDTGTIEYETPCKYDVDSVSAQAWESDNINRMNRFLGINLPAVYTVGAHEQLSMTKPEYITSTKNMIIYTKNSGVDCNYNDLTTLTNYIKTIQASRVKVLVNGNQIYTSMILKAPVKKFTIKLNNIENGLLVTLDGAPVPASAVKYEDGFYYVSCDIPSGGHKFNVTDTSDFASKTYYTSKTGVVSKPIYS